ncbi:flagellar basal body P-ring formation chaperone FlgA [Granulosicoccus antarcticus]|nr:flagellar basal body P-ring formation chaperone FlgA [Granulosicoccus antarcticus]
MNILIKWKRAKFCLILCLLLIPVFPVTAETGDRQSLDAIAHAVREFVTAEQTSTDGVQVEVKALDNRLRLAQCDAPLDTYWSPGSRSIGRVTVQVECASPKPWRVHVQSTVTQEGYVWVLSRGVQRGDLLDPDLLVKQIVKLGASNAALNSLGTPILDVKPWLGYAFSQRVGAGKMLNERMLKPANLIKKGDAVLIRIESAGLKLQTKGVALKDAAAGKFVQVRNIASGRVVDAVALRKGVVVVLN